jgi:polyadenylate-binding protein 2
MTDVESTQPTTNGNSDPTIDDGDDAETNVRRITP